MTHKFDKPAIQIMILQSILRHSQQHEVWPQSITINPVHLPYAKLFLAMSAIEAVGDANIAPDEVITS